MKNDKIGIGLVGSKFISTIHAESLKRVNDAVILAVASPSLDHAEVFSKHHKILYHYNNYKKMLEMDEIDMIVIGAPNVFHYSIAVDSAAAGKHVVMEKPFCLNLQEADLLVKTFKQANLKLMYAEELCFAPKYVRLKQLLDQGALGVPILIKQSEKHDGPHAPHFWDVEQSGGGVTMDMGCHAIEFFRWMLGRPKIKSDKTKGDDNAIIILEFENEVMAIAEESWTKPGGMDDKAEVHGTGGVAYADLLQGNSILTYSHAGVEYAVEKSGSTKGWSFTIYDEIWNYGFPQEFSHFVDCVKNNKQPRVTGEDGQAVLEVIFAAYESAKTGKKVALPFSTDATKPHDLWKND
jgi:predicted dehydrogenase